MIHLDEGALRALMDGELEQSEHESALQHVSLCERCARALEEERALAFETSRALRAIDTPASVARARSALDQRLAQRRDAKVTPLAAAPGRAPARRWRRLELARAAALVLVLTGAVASTVPGSPVREWLAVAWERVTRARRPDSPASVQPPAAPQPEEAGVRVGPSDGTVRILLTELPPGANIQVQLTDGATAAVFSGTGSRFRTGPGLVEAAVLGEDIRIEIPRGVGRASVEVDGQVWYRKLGDRLELLGPGPDSTGAEVRFRVPSPTTPPR